MENLVHILASSIGSLTNVSKIEATFKKDGTLANAILEANPAFQRI